MPTVLVVDDSALDRRHIGELLDECPDLHVEYATDGGEALARIERAEPDLVVTDLIMPGVNGLELVTASRDRHPLVPVILMTSKGSEEVAVEALQLGAASYVPKHMLARQLPDTIYQVLAVSGRQRSYTRLMGCMTKSHCEFVLENDCSLIPPLVRYLQDSVGHFGFCADADRTRIGIALEEALANALCHGNLEIGSELRGTDEQAHDSLIQQRRGQAPYCDRRIHVQATLDITGATFHVRDEGPGFDPSQLPDPTDPENLEKCSGRGILLMRTFMDQVLFNDQGNAVTMLKRCKHAAQPTP